MGFIDQVKERAKTNKKTIVLPETGDMRTLEAAHKVLAEGIADLVLIGNKDAILQAAGDLDLTKAQFVDPSDCAKMDVYIDTLVEARKKKGMTPEEAKKLLLSDPLFFGATLVKAGDADGMVAGAVNASANVLRAALQVVKTAPGVSVVSTFFLMVVPDCEFLSSRTAG